MGQAKPTKHKPQKRKKKALMLLVHKLLLSSSPSPDPFPLCKILVSSRRPAYHLYTHGNPAPSASQSWYHMSDICFFTRWACECGDCWTFDSSITPRKTTSPRNNKNKPKPRTTCLHQNFCFELYSTPKCFLL